MSTLITKDMPEPKEYGPYLVTHPDNASAYPCLLIHDEMDTIGHSWMGDVGWDLWSTVQREYEGCAIESLTAHDARIRREALELNGGELHAVCQMVLGTSPRTFHTSGLRMALDALAKARERSNHE